MYDTKQNNKNIGANNICTVSLRIGADDGKKTYFAQFKTHLKPSQRNKIKFKEFTIGEQVSTYRTLRCPGDMEDWLINTDVRKEQKN